MDISFSLDSTKVEKKLTGLVNAFSDFSKPFNEVGTLLLHFYGFEVFESQGGAISESWRALAPSTLYMRAKRQGYYRNTPRRTDKILVWTGRLQDGFKKDVKPMELRISNDVPYFKYHQTAKGRPAQRRMLAITSNVISITVDQINKYVEKAVKA